MIEDKKKCKKTTYEKNAQLPGRPHYTNTCGHPIKNIVQFFYYLHGLHFDIYK